MAAGPYDLDGEKPENVSQETWDRLKRIFDDIWEDCMAKYIKATDAAEILSEKYGVPYADLVDDFAEIPTADVAEVRHGRWIDMAEDDQTEGMWRCSVCGDDRYFEGLATPYDHGAYYCPACGAKMDGGIDNV